MMNKKQTNGFSMVELLVAMAVGVIIVGGAFSLHSASRDIQKSSEMQMDMVADARFAIEMISYDLRAAGMWGGTNKSGLIECKSSEANCASTSSGDTPPTAALATNDCAAGWYYNLTNPIFATDESDGNPYAVTCIPAAEGHVATTDILEIRYADANIVPGLLAGQVYVRSNFVNGRVFVGGTAPVISAYDDDPLTRNYVLRAYAYYVSDFTDAPGDGIPSLRRIALVNGPELQNQTLISGVSNFQVQLGIDVDGVEDINGNLTIDRYVDPDQVTDWSAVYAAKIWLLMRSDEKQIGVNTKKSFIIAGAAAQDYGNQDDYRYFMVTSVVNLRNLKQL